MKHASPSKVDFGAEVYGIDLNSFTDADFDLISDALHEHKLLVFKEQPAMLSPQQQFRLTSRYVSREKACSFSTKKHPVSILMRLLEDLRMEQIRI